MLAYPATLMGATFVAALAARFGSRAAAVGAALCIAFAFWSSAKNEDGIRFSSAWSTTPISVGADLMNEARHRYYPRSERVSYMVFGGNSENAHAAFLEDGFDLSCRWFHLYPVSLDSQFEETLDCAHRERPDLVLITLGFFDERAVSMSAGAASSAARERSSTRATSRSPRPTPGSRSGSAGVLRRETRASHGCARRAELGPIGPDRARPVPHAKRRG